MHCWRQAGISSGDVVLLHSSVSRTMREARKKSTAFSTGDLLQTFIDAVGPEGTLLLPLFNFAFCNGETFNRQDTPSMMGSLTETARTDPRFKRTRHPIYSFAVTGPYADKFVQLHNISALGDNGPFGMLRRIGGKVAVLDLDDQNSMTIYHHIEEVVGVDYRVHKSFTGEYVDCDGATTVRTYQLFVWDEQRGVQTDVNRAGEHLWSRGAYSGERPGIGAGLRVISAQMMFDEIQKIILDGKAQEYLYSISGVTHDS